MLDLGAKVANSHSLSVHSSLGSPCSDTHTQDMIMESSTARKTKNIYLP